jgi:hypothetical protein
MLIMKQIHAVFASLSSTLKLKNGAVKRLWYSYNFVGKIIILYCAGESYNTRASNPVKHTGWWYMGKHVQIVAYNITVLICHVQLYCMS